MMIKICGITGYEDAIAAVDEGATAIGFNFYPKSPRYIQPAAAAFIAAQLPRTIMSVGVFVDAPINEIVRITGLVSLDIIQLHGAEPPELLAQLPVPVWKAVRVTPGFTPHVLDSYQAAAFLLDSPGPSQGGNGTTFDWLIARGIKNKRLVLAGGLSAGNVAEAIATAQPWGVDACSKIERSPGVKDHKKMAAFISAAKRASPS